MKIKFNSSISNSNAVVSNVFVREAPAAGFPAWPFGVFHVCHAFGRSSCWFALKFLFGMDFWSTLFYSEVPWQQSE